jgi:hypothetical protein
MENWKTLLELRRVTELTGEVHDLQIFQLKMWPLVAAPNATGHTARLDIPNKTLSYLWEMGKRKRTKDWKKRVGGLVSSSQSLFGSSWTVIVIENGVEIANEPGTTKKDPLAESVRESGIIGQRDLLNRK